MQQNQQNRYDQSRDPTFYQNCLTCCGWCTGGLKIWCPCICCCCNTPIYKVQTSQSGILQRFGKFKDILQPGLSIINPMTDSVILVDMKTKVTTLPVQPVITKDNITVRVQTAVYYRIVDSFKMAYRLGTEAKVLNFIAEMSQAALRSVGGQHTLQDMLSNRQKIALELKRFVINQAQPWGIVIENIFLKDLLLDPETERNLSAAAKQKRIAQASIISAQADVNSAKMLKQAAEILDSKAAMQIRYLEMIQQLAQKPSPKLIFLNLRGKQ